VTLKQSLMQRVVEPSALRYFQWRGDPVARLMHPNTRANPYPLYAEVRGRGLVKSSVGSWMTATHATVNQVLLDKRFSSAPVHQKGYQPPRYADDDPRFGIPSDSILIMDPPDHTRIRRLVSSAFGPKAIAALEPWIRDTTDGLLDRLDASGFDLIDEVALPLPIAVICHLLGVPAEDEDKFRVWGNDVASSLDPSTTRSQSKRVEASDRALTAYLKDLVAKRRLDPDESLLSALIAVEEEGDRLTFGELVSTALLILIAGFETTVNLIGNGTVALLSEPESWRRLSEEPPAVALAIEELLRYDSPVQLTSRTATEELELEGETLPRGQNVILALGGANRDPAAFDEPDRLLIDREDAGRHLSFSMGLHHCLGAALARLEGRAVVEALTRRFPTLEGAATPTRRPLLVLRGFEHVPLRSA
jgi:cytochrome P450